jgi:TRAP-type mannitol/chloroaromatic compound transport system permease small subunit
MEDARLLWVDRISAWAGKLFAWSVVIMTVAICYEVFMRYVMRAPTTWAYDAGYMLYGALFVMAGAYALATGGMSGATCSTACSRPAGRPASTSLYILFFFPAILALIYAGWIFAERSWAIREISSASPAGLPVYHFKA